MCYSVDSLFDDSQSTLKNHTTRNCEDKRMVLFTKSVFESLFSIVLPNMIVVTDVISLLSLCLLSCEQQSVVKSRGYYEMEIDENG